MPSLLIFIGRKTPFQRAVLKVITFVMVATSGLLFLASSADEAFGLGWGLGWRPALIGLGGVIAGMALYRIQIALADAADREVAASTGRSAKTD